MDFTILEARKFTSGYSRCLNRHVKDYEFDIECVSGRIYSYGAIHDFPLSYGDVLVRKPHGIVSTKGIQNTSLLTLDFSNSMQSAGYSRNLPGPFQAPFEHELLAHLDPIIHPKNIDAIMRIYERLFRLPDLGSAAAKELVRELLYLLNAEMARKNYELLKPRETVANALMTYMRENLTKRITLNDLSAFACLEKTYLSRLFRTETGKTPIEALIEMRLSKASDLIVTTNLSVHEIASECGYCTVSFFISSYKKQYGITPEAHRRMIKERAEAHRQKS